MYRLAFALTAVLAVVAGLLVGTLNAGPATLDLLWFRLGWPLGLLVLAALSVGLVIGIGLCWLFVVLPERLRRRRRQVATPAVAGGQEPPGA